MLSAAWPAVVGTPGGTQHADLGRDPPRARHPSLLQRLFCQRRGTCSSPVRC
jgi:hypothetical protein